MRVPWLKGISSIEGPREEIFPCTGTPEECLISKSWWVSWGMYDHAYAEPTIYLCLGFIGIFAITNLIARLTNKARPTNAFYRHIVAVSRYATYRKYRLTALNWHTPTLGIMFMGFMGTAFFFGMVLGPRPIFWPADDIKRGYPPIATRTAWLAVACIPFIFLLVAKANLISAVTGVCYQKLNVFHRWLSYAMLVLSILHTCPIVIFELRQGTWSKTFRESTFLWTGIAALIPMAWLCIMSLPPIRKRFYEFFKFFHYIASLLCFFFLIIHCAGALTSWDYFIATGALYLASLLYSTIRTHLVYGRAFSGELALLPGGVIELCITPRPKDASQTVSTSKFNWTTLQHAYVRADGLVKNKKVWHQWLGAWSSHPFTIGSLPPIQREGEAEEPARLRFLIMPPSRGRGGFTHNLMNHVMEATERKTGEDIASSKATVPVTLDGPYGGLPVKTFAPFDHVLIFAGGSGSIISLPIIEDILRQITTHSITPPQVHLHLVTRYLEIQHWSTTEIETLVQQYPCTYPEDWLHIHFHITGGGYGGLERPATLELLEKGEHSVPPQITSVDLLAVKQRLAEVAPCTGPHRQIQKESEEAAEEGPTADDVCKLEQSQSRVSSEGSTIQLSLTSSHSSSLSTTVASLTDKKNDSQAYISEGFLNIKSVAGRPAVHQIVAEATCAAGASIGIAVCGPSSLSYDVCNAAAHAQLAIIRGDSAKAREVYLHTECFGG